MQWHEKGTAPTKKFKVTLSAGETHDNDLLRPREGILMIDYKEKYIFITGKSYVSILERLNAVIRAKRRRKLTKSARLLHENTPVHKNRVVSAVLHKVCWITAQFWHHRTANFGFPTSGLVVETPVMQNAPESIKVKSRDSVKQSFIEISKVSSSDWSAIGEHRLKRWKAQ